MVVDGDIQSRNQISIKSKANGKGFELSVVSIVGEHKMGDGGRVIIRGK